MLLFESEKSCFCRDAVDYLSLLELCVKNVVRLELSRPFYVCADFVVEQQPYKALRKLLVFTDWITGNILYVKDVKGPS